MKPTNILNASLNIRKLVYQQKMVNNTKLHKINRTHRSNSRIHSHIEFDPITVMLNAISIHNIPQGSTHP